MTDPTNPAPGSAATALPDIRRTALHPDYWYPVARSRALKPGKAIGVTFGGEPIALVRPESGEPFALEDRCAHRQVPLHLGDVQSDRLRCTYHCWAYDRHGKCVNVPYLDRGRQLPNGVRAYPCREAYGLVFVYMGDPAAPGFQAFPQVDRYDDPAYRTRFLDRRVQCHYSFMHENLMDMNHQFLHRSLMGSIRTTFMDLRVDDSGVEVDYTFSRAAGKQPLGERFMLGRRPAPTAERSRDLMTIRTDYPYQWLRFWTAGSEEPALDLWNCYIPIDREQRVNHTFGLMNIRRPGIPGLINVLWPFIAWFTDGIFAQDRRIVELEQAAFEAQGGDWNNEIFPVIQALRDCLRSSGVPVTGTPSLPG